MKVLDEIVANRRKLIDMEKRKDIIRDLRDFIGELGIDIEKNRKLKLSKAIKKAKEIKNPIITEIKPSSPSKGNIREITLEDIKDIAKEMVEGGAIALSILTEPKYFNGSYKNLIVAREVDIPILMKDFIVDFYQIDIANEIGANAILLIVSALKEDLGEFLDYAKENDLECLVEVHSEDEVDIALDAGAKIIGINNRDLKTLKIDLSTTEKISPLIPKNKIKIGESGIYTKEQLNYILKFADAALIGSSIMESENIKEKVMELVRK
ncbi:indole-3-glycerol phosphate synthase TrpC [Methanocaldococcus fervens]|uniref:Indole-3-glycerol phosphate synthase n=1 Tax=Methanocaldococcus fervens (strain DSM 4213 / JCM 15782 / AG86) TaxID=573064 RepID=C7P5S8_METFA|nr:indole-3-glycerol-phosphate synthase [Methanocaldococcus fervens]ACV23910.1 Indole-3-glycerol-phosphate synthase [Methanocaldococcus fervens AG86]